MNKHAFGRNLALAAAMAFCGAALADNDKSYDLPPLYVDECGSCHVAYPPQLMSAESWRALMAGLDEHFGSDASVEAGTAAKLAAWLDDNAGQKSKYAAAGNLYVSRTPWFRKEHRDGEHGLEPAVWKSAAVKSASNCGACHLDAERGDYSERRIRVPRQGSAEKMQPRHSGEGRNPYRSTTWTPAFADVTNTSAHPQGRQR